MDMLPRYHPSRPSEWSHRLRRRVCCGTVRAWRLDLRSSSPAGVAALVTGQRSIEAAQTTGWIAVGRRGRPFPGDERDRYASRFRAIATEHGGAFSQFVEEPDETPAAHAAESLATGEA
jgi:hypothetical protein